MKKITGLHVNTRTGKASYETIDANLESYYKTLDCTTIDIVSRQVGCSTPLAPSLRFDIICDDEALLKSPCVPSALGLDYNYCLYGDLFVVGHDDGSEDIRSLTKEERRYLSRNTHSIYTGVGNGYQTGLICVRA